MYSLEVINILNLVAAHGVQPTMISAKPVSRDTLAFKNLARRRALLAREGCTCKPTESFGVIIDLNCRIHGR